MKKETINNIKVLIALVLMGLLMQNQNIFNSYITQILIFSLSIYGLVKSADNFTDYAVTIGDKLGLSKLATGVLIIAIGTSAPEFFSSISAAIHEQYDMVIGNVLGTVIANTLLGIGIGALFIKSSSKISKNLLDKLLSFFKIDPTAYLKVHSDVLGNQMSILFVAIVLSIGSLYDGSLEYYEGIAFLILLVYYLIDVYRSSKNQTAIDEVEEHHSEISSPLILVFLLVLNLSFLFASGEGVVSSLIEGSKLFNISGAILATTILAVGTSIPEIATAIALVRKNNIDSLFGEIIGSNIFDILGIFGLISLFTDLVMETHLLHMLLASVFIMFLLSIFIMNDKKVSKLEGIGLVSIFYIFIVILSQF